jgi:hypothetical protein
VLNADATWCAVSPVSGTNNGTAILTVSANPTLEARTASVTLTTGTANKTVPVTQQPSPFPPPYPASTQTWHFESADGAIKQTWSDAIYDPACDKQTFNSGGGTIAPVADCRCNTADGKLYYYYSWSYVDARKEALCPSPWRVPTMVDLIGLAQMTGISPDKWEVWRFGGFATNNGGVFNIWTAAYYWSENGYSPTDAYALFFDTEREMPNAGLYPKDNGLQVRCVKTE